MSDSIRVSEQHGVNPCIPVCLFCKQPKDEIALLGRLPNDRQAPMHAILNYEPCDKCQAVMDQGITFMECVPKKGPTGRMVVLKEEAVRNMLNDPMLSDVLKHRGGYLAPELYEELFGHLPQKEAEQ